MAHGDLEELCTRAWRYAMALARDESRADDLVQEAWAAMLAAGAPPTVGYLLRAVRSRWVDGWRRDRRVVALPTPEPVPPASDRVDARLAIGPAWARLREEEREALFLCVVEGLTAAEVAEHTGRPRNTVLSLLHRGRARLREAIELADREVMP